MNEENENGLCHEQYHVRLLKKLHFNLNGVAGGWLEEKKNTLQRDFR